ncbi:type II toxin-antitoxin system RelE/ParE family toxin [Brucella cytisi]|uniref:type II toxin-antitoxin system RelE/ParE family toxin n=1 Tax=Brucella cytisi TaxID=407152 RepID=UPI0035BC7F8C
MQRRDDIYHYIETDNPAAARALDERFSEKANRLVDHPSLGRPGRRTGSRELIEHQSFCLICDVRVNAMRVLHVKRQLPPKRVSR